jgi:hypothetical protein
VRAAPRVGPRGRPRLIAATPSVVAVYRTSGHYATGHGGAHNSGKPGRRDGG